MPGERARSDSDETVLIERPRAKVVPISKSVAAMVAHHRALEEQFTEWHFERIDLPAYRSLSERRGLAVFWAWVRG